MRENLSDFLDWIKIASSRELIDYLKDEEGVSVSEFNYIILEVVDRLVIRDKEIIERENFRMLLTHPIPKSALDSFECIKNINPISIDEKNNA